MRLKIPYEEPKEYFIEDNTVGDEIFRHITVSGTILEIQDEHYVVEIPVITSREEKYNEEQAYEDEVNWWYW